VLTLLRGLVEGMAALVAGLLWGIGAIVKVFTTDGGFANQ